jgi:hypothetical protein
MDILRQLGWLIKPLVVDKNSIAEIGMSAVVSLYEQRIGKDHHTYVEPLMEF